MFSSAGLSLGPMLLGFVLDTILFGMVVAQSLVYFSCYKSDARWLKFFVACLLALDTLNVILELVYLYNTFIFHFGDMRVLLIADWVFSTIPGTTGITSALVQLFFAWRIRVLQQSRLLIAGIIVLALAGMLSGIGTSIAVNLVPMFTRFHNFKSIVIIWLSSSAVDNLLITTSLVLSLREYRTGFADTDHMIKKIIRVTLHTGLLTAIWTILSLVVYLAVTNGMHLVFVLPLAKFYTNSLLSTLIARTRDSNDREFTVVDFAHHIEHQDNVSPFDTRDETRTRTTDIVFDTVSVKVLQGRVSFSRETYDNSLSLSSRSLAMNA